MKIFDDIVKTLQIKKETIATMESCTGGALASAITNVSGSSDVFSFGAVTYSSDYKIKLGVDEKIIQIHTVYSLETARAMSKAICDFTNSDYGVGITGKLNAQDKNNPSLDIQRVDISIYQKKTNTYHDVQMQVTALKREDCKNQVLEQVALLLESLL